jgi:hypothetical protein
MKRTRQNTYVERELRRQRAEKKRRIIEKVTIALASFALIVCTEVFMFALVLMS